MDPEDCGSPLPPPGPSWAAEPLESRPGQGSILPCPHHVHFPKAVGGGWALCTQNLPEGLDLAPAPPGARIILGSG